MFCLGKPNVITKVLISEKCQKSRCDHGIRGQSGVIAGFEDGKRQ